MEQTWWWTWMHIWKQLWNVDFLCFDQLYTGPCMHLDQKTSLSCPPSLCAHVALSWWLGGRGLWAPSKRPCLMITLPRGRKQQDAWDSSSPALLPSQQVQGRVWVERWLSSGGSPCEAWNERKERQYAGINQTKVKHRSWLIKYLRKTFLCCPRLFRIQWRLSTGDGCVSASGLWKNVSPYFANCIPRIPCASFIARSL